MSKRDDMLRYAYQFVGVPYKYGGNDLATGVDCSGLVNGVLRHFDLVPQRDHAAQWLYWYFTGQRDKYEGEVGHDPGDIWNRTTKARKPGNIVFFGRHRVSHVAFIVDHCDMLEAAGGDSSTKALAYALTLDAKVKVSRINRRTDFHSIVDPFAQLGE